LPTAVGRQKGTAMKTISRSQFIRVATVGSVGITLPAWAKQDKPASLSVELVKDFVSVSHGNFARVKELLETEPQLLHASFDWGGGDFESGIEAAGHVGNKQIAHYLLSKGARYNVYLACMLGHLDTVKNVLTFRPDLLNSMGPHGFTMLHHANKGGDEAKAVVDYLTSLGAKETKLDFYTKK
jgi:hypothetical protein